MGIFTKYPRDISIPLRVGNSEIYLKTICLFDTQKNPETKKTPVTISKGKESFANL